jgi:hypothetical protein
MREIGLGGWNFGRRKIAKVLRKFRKEGSGEGSQISNIFCGPTQSPHRSFQNKKKPSLFLLVYITGINEHSYHIKLDFSDI